MPQPRAPRAFRIAVLATAVLAAACVRPGSARQPAAKPYEESGSPSGRTLLEKLATVSQFDALSETTSDSLRGSCAASLSAYLLLGGDFATLARRFDVPAKLTYANLHRVQDALYRNADRDGTPGVLATAAAEYDSAGALTGWSLRGGDEYHRVLEALDLDAERLYGPTRERPTEKGVRIGEILAEDSTALFVVGLLEDPETGTSHELIGESPANHAVLVMWHDGGWSALDSWRAPGQSALASWSPELAEAMLLRTKNDIYRVRRRR